MKVCSNAAIFKIIRDKEEGQTNLKTAAPLYVDFSVYREQGKVVQHLNRYHK
jgi:hypothetical protein